MCGFTDEQRTLLFTKYHMRQRKVYVAAKGNLSTYSLMINNDLSRFVLRLRSICDDSSSSFVAKQNKQLSAGGENGRLPTEVENSTF